MVAISVLIPVYNGASFLQETLDSLYKQRLQDFEIVIIDDASTDDTAAIIARQKTDKIRYFLNEKNSGIVFTLNRGLRLCQGKYIARMDADDIALPERLAAQFNYMEAHPDVVLLGSSIHRFSDSYGIDDWRGGEDAIVRAKLVFDTAINHPSAILRNAVIQENRLSYPSDCLHAEDYAFWYTLSQYGKLANLDAILLKYRMHGNNLSMQHTALQYQNMNKMRLRIMEDFWVSEGEKGAVWMQKYRALLQKTLVTIVDMQALDLLFQELFEANQRKCLYNDASLKKAAAWFWYVVFTHENCPKYSPKMIVAFLLNKKSVAQYLEPIYQKKLLVKSLLCMKKK